MNSRRLMALPSGAAPVQNSTLRKAGVSSDAVVKRADRFPPLCVATGLLPLVPPATDIAQGGPQVRSVPQADMDRYSLGRLEALSMHCRLCSGRNRPSPDRCRDRRRAARSTVSNWTYAYERTGHPRCRISTRPCWRTDLDSLTENFESARTFSVLKPIRPGSSADN
jgi:hypothetical protein